MIQVQEFEPRLSTLLPATYSLLMTANLTLHPAVRQVTLHGSRGLAGGYRPDSDIDLSLLVNTGAQAATPDLEPLLRDVLETTLNHWQGSVEADVAVIFDIRDCGLKCFEWSRWREQLCLQGGVDCFGLYKRQQGAYGFIEHAGIEVKRMYPCLTIFRRT